LPFVTTASVLYLTCGYNHHYCTTLLCVTPVIQTDILFHLAPFIDLKSHTSMSTFILLKYCYQTPKFANVFDFLTKCQSKQNVCFSPVIQLAQFDVDFNIFSSVHCATSTPAQFVVFRPVISDVAGAYRSSRRQFFCKNLANNLKASYPFSIPSFL